MTLSWNSLYLPCDDALLPALQHSLTALGYTLYQPFGLLPGKAYPYSVKLFAAPPANGWTRVIGAPDLNQLPLLSQTCLCLCLSLDTKDAQIQVLVDGEQADPCAALIPYLRPERTADDLHKALHSPLSLLPQAESSGPTVIALLPGEWQAMAGQVNPAQAQKLFERVSGTLMGKVSPGGRLAEEARRMAAGGESADWKSVGGQRLRGLMACLTVPDGWREPDFVTLRDAYQLHERRRRNPNARLYPGDADAMQRVPKALEYTPVYGGRH